MTIVTCSRTGLLKLVLEAKEEFSEPRKNSTERQDII